MKTDKKIIGVLGGMGPEATLLFMQKVIQAVPARDDADHIPMIIDNNTQVPSRIKALIEKTGEDSAPTLAAMAKRLETAGAQALVMPCNTAHIYHDHIRHAVEIPFLSMVDLTVERIALDNPGARVGILASPAVRLTGLFETALKEAGLTPVYPEDQASILLAIKALKRSAHDGNASKTAHDAAAELTAEGCGILLVSCTEFSLLADELRKTFRIIDSLDVLVEAAVSYSLGVPALSEPHPPATKEDGGP